MTARRRRDPRLPAWSIFEDVEAVVDGVPVFSAPPPSGVDRAIIEANDEQLRTLRRVGGRDMDDWLLDADDALRAHDWARAVALLRPVVAASLRLAQFDSREPDWHRVLMLARAHRGQGDRAREEAVIRVWLAHWPPDRETTNRNRDTATRRLAAVRRRGNKNGMGGGPVAES